MKTLHEYLKSLNIKKFIQVMKKYKVTEREQESYLLFIERLITEVPINSDIILKLNFEEDNELAISGLNKDGNTFAIDFIPWEECLGYLINEANLVNNTIEELIYSALYDMSFDGFYKEHKEEKLQELLRRKEN
jgi:hypothetical protein